MATRATTARIDSSTLRLSVHRRAIEKLGLVSWFMPLFPAPALDRFVREKQEHRCEAQVKHHGPRVVDAAGKILHVIDQTKVREQLRSQTYFRLKSHRDETHDQQSDACGDAHDGGNDLALRQRRRQAPKRCVET